MLEYVHVSCVCNGAGGGSVAFAMNEGYGLSPHIKHKGVHQRHTVLVARLTGHLAIQERIID